MKVFVFACVLVSTVSAMPQFQLGVQPARAPAQASRPAPTGPRTQEEILDTPDPYNFALEVNDDEFTNYQTRVESQDENGVVKGQYSYIAPNGVRYTVTYTADAINGYQADIREEQTDVIVRNPVIAKQPPEQRGAPLAAAPVQRGF